MNFLCFQKSSFRGNIKFFRRSHQRTRLNEEFYRQLSHQRKHNIVGEMNVSSSTPISIYEKDEKTKELIKKAISSNGFLGNLEESRIQELVSVVYPINVNPGTRLIREGETGSRMFVSEEGTFEILIGATAQGRFGPGVAFGELALLYDTKRFCSIDARTRGKIWVLDRHVFQTIMFRSYEKTMQYHLQALRRISILKSLHDEILVKICDLISVEFYSANSYIIREGDVGNKFYIVNGGRVRITKNKEKRGSEVELTILDRGDYFGEKALYDSEESRRRANAIAVPPGAELLTIDRKSFLDYLGGLESIKNRDWQIDGGRTVPEDCWDYEFRDLSLSDFTLEGTIGTGGYGRVELVVAKSMPGLSFARKKLKKRLIGQGGFQTLVYNEKNNLKLCNSPFVCKLYRTFKDSRYIYFLTEACLGGDLRTALHAHRRFENSTSRFLVACVVEALDHVHSLGIVYRDLKPENIVIDTRGYLKLTDFGSSKYIGPHKTKTLMGTAEYLAPEILRSKPYDKAADYWALGILVYELLLGYTPFQDYNEVEVFNKILRGFEQASLAPAFLRNSAKNFIRSLLRQDPVERLGCTRRGVTDIRNHRWFGYFGWVDLQNGTLLSPIVPKIKNHLDLSNFERYPPDREPAPTDFSDWDTNF